MKTPENEEQSVEIRGHFPHVKLPNGQIVVSLPTNENGTPKLELCLSTWGTKVGGKAKCHLCDYEE
jgi:hypothetical protein